MAIDLGSQTETDSRDHEQFRISRSHSAIPRCLEDYVEGLDCRRDTHTRTTATDILFLSHILSIQERDELDDILAA